MRETNFKEVAIVRSQEMGIGRWEKETGRGKGEMKGLGQGGVGIEGIYDMHAAEKKRE